MKLEVGMFLRTNDGKITKFIKYDEKDKNELVTDYYEYSTIWIKDIIKASFNIIDLIEVGDYVNGCYVSNKRASLNEHLGGHPKGIGIIKCNAYFNQGNYNDCKFEWIEDKDIKSVITHEQMEQISYRLGE